MIWRWKRSRREQEESSQLVSGPSAGILYEGETEGMVDGSLQTTGACTYICAQASERRSYKSTL